MKKLFLALILVITIVLGSVIFVLPKINLRNSETYVGVTYGGNSVTEAKSLIDRVKGYTNLFVLQSGLLQRDYNSVEEIGDYAVSAGLYFLPYFGSYIKQTMSAWLETANQKWGDHLLGIYYNDEVGGKMLDDNVNYENSETGDSITKTKYGDIVVKNSNGTVVHYEISGAIHLYKPENGNSTNGNYSEQMPIITNFYADGTITITEPNGQTEQNPDLKNLPTYQDLISIKPFNNNEDAAERFLANDKDNIEFLKNKSIKVFTSDYAMYWFDYLSGYDVILAQIGWNHSLTQQIALARGAAKLQNREWGIVVTWKYTTGPYLDTPQEILNQMKTAYESGAKYIVLFNYYEENDDPYGTLTDEYFQAMETFWNEIVRNPNVNHGSIKADAVLVFPKNYAWGMRWKEDKIWGIFRADEKTFEYWDQLQNTLEKHDTKLDIVFSDNRFPLTTDYQYVYRLDS